jgi:glycosyltransferase involved in cell wall biosynthesis
MIIYNLKGPQVACAAYTVRRLGLPVILEYEDDRFVSLNGEKMNDLISRYQHRACARVLDMISGCIGVSPRLLSQARDNTPKMLLRGVVGDDIVRGRQELKGEKKNWILFSGTHVASNGVAELIDAWRHIGLPDWELHITGNGQLTDGLREMARSVSGLVFHGLVDRSALVHLMCSARVCINPHHVSRTPGNVFAFKIVEYLASGAHVITTPMGALEPELEAGVTYMANCAPRTIAETIRRVIRTHEYERTAGDAAQQAYGSNAVSRSLDSLVGQVTARQ